jgi:WD40 repeat protein
MATLSTRELRQMFDRVAAHYEDLTESKSALEADCARLRECIDHQVQQIRMLNSDFEKMIHSFTNRPSEPPPPQPPPSEDPPDQDWEIEAFPPAGKLARPLLISLLSEVRDTSVVCSTAFSPRGERIAIGSDRALRVYDVDRDEFQLHCAIEDGAAASNHIRSICWARDGQALICGCEDGRVRLFLLPQGRLKHSREVAAGEVFQLAVAHCKPYFASVAADGVLSILRLSDCSVIATLQRELAGAPAVAICVAISADDETIAVGYGDFQVALWDADSHRLLSLTACHSSGVCAVKFVPNSQRLVTGSLDSAIKIWEIKREGSRTLELVSTLEGHSSYVLSLAVDPTGELLVSGSKDLTAVVSSIPTGTMLYRLKAHSNSVISVAFSSRGNLFCTGSGDQSVKVWAIAREAEGA